jgi:hypothetical protein
LEELLTSVLDVVNALLTLKAGVPANWKVPSVCSSKKVIIPCARTEGWWYFSWYATRFAAQLDSDQHTVHHGRKSQPTRRISTTQLLWLPGQITVLAISSSLTCLDFANAFNSEHSGSG